VAPTSGATSDETVEPLPPEYAELSNGEWFLVGSRCTECGSKFFPETLICADCTSRAMERTHLAREGTVYTKTTVALAPEGFEAPYGIAWVDLPDGPRAFGQLEDSDNVAIGDRVVVTVGVIRRNRDGRAVAGHRFRKIS